MSSGGPAVPERDESTEANRWESLALELGRLTPSGQHAFLHSHPFLVQRVVLESLAEAIRSAFRTDVPKALELASASVVIAERLGDDREFALALRAMGNALSLSGRCSEALELFDRAVDLFRKAGDSQEEGRTLSTAIRSYLLLGNYQDAFNAADQARLIFETVGDTLRIARLEINVANIYHRQNHFGEALESYERAYLQLLPHGDIEGVGVALHNVAVCRIALDDFAGALEAYGRLRSLCESHGMPLLVAQADYNSAYLHFLRGDYTQALSLLQDTREIYRKNGDEYHLGLCDLDQSEIYIELGLSEEAIEMAQYSCERFQKLGMGFEVGRSLANRAIALGQQSRFSLALKSFKEAKQLFLAEENQAWPSLIDLYCSLMLCEEGDWEEAGRLGRQSLGGIRDSAMPGKEAQALLLISRVSLRSGDLAGAIELCDSATTLVNKLELPSLSFQTSLLRGDLYETAGNPRAAFDSYQSCRKTLQSIQSGLHADELKIGVMRSRVQVYERLARLCLARSSNQARAAEEAFGYVEEARSRSLRDLIFQRAESALEADHASKSSTQVRQEHLRKELNWFYHRIEREELSKERIAPELLDGLRNEARLRERELLRLEREQPVKAKIKTDRSSRPASLDEIRTSLIPGSLLIEYFAIEDELWGAVISSRGLQVRRLSALSTVHQHMRLLNFQMNTMRLSGAYRERFGEQLLHSVQAHLRALYQDLITPVRDLLEGDHLVIIPYGPLHTLPFHALLDSGKYLIEQFSISYSPSATIYTLRKSVQDTRAKRSLILGVDSETTPFVRSEAEAVASAVRAPELLLGPDATEASLRAKGRDSAIIHIATHGYFRQDNPMFSSIRLADSHLSLYDLYHMALPADLLTLSGCVTGVNVVTAGDELVGLARGLLYAGAKSLLLSLWDVDDRSTADFMGLFYQNLRSGRRKAQALQATMVDFLSSHPHPYYWAPFKLTNTAQNE